MKSYIILLVLASAGLSTHCQPAKVPDAVRKAFVAKYPNATEVKWGKENAKEYEAEFKLNNNSISANFGTDGSWVETESEIPAADLPASVMSTVKTKYPAAQITMAEKTEQPGKILYGVTVKVNNKKRSMEINPDGTIAH